MDDNYDPVGYSDVDLMAQQEALARRKAILQEQARQAAARQGIYAPYQPNLQEIGGFTLSSQAPGASGTRIPGRVVPATWGTALSAIAPLVAQYRNDQEQSAYDRAAADFKAAVRKDAARRIAAMPVPRAADPGIQPLTPNDDEGNPMPIPKEATPAYEPTLRERLEWAASLQNNPETAALGTAYTTDALLKEPERIAAREERKAEKEAQRAEARRKQEEDLKWRTWQQTQHNQTLATIASLRGGRGGGGGGGSGSTAGLDLTDENGNPVEGWKRANVKASDIVKTETTDGTIFLTDKLTGQKLRVGAGGRSSAANDKDRNDTRDQIENSRQAIAEAPHVDKLLTEASSSGLSADVRRAAGYIGGYSDKASQADKQLNVAADKYVKAVPRFSGPTSDGDRKDYAKAAGQLADTNAAPEDRRAALREVVRLHQKSLQQMQERSTFSGDFNARKRDNGANYNTGNKGSTSGDPLVDRWLNK